MTDTLWIKPKGTDLLPFESAPSKRITGPTPVASSPYYRRALAKGVIVECTKAEIADASAPPSKK